MQTCCGYLTNEFIAVVNFDVFVYKILIVYFPEHYTSRNTYRYTKMTLLTILINKHTSSRPFYHLIHEIPKIFYFYVIMALSFYYTTISTTHQPRHKKHQTKNQNTIIPIHPSQDEQKEKNTRK